MLKIKNFLAEGLWIYYPAFMLPILLDIPIWDWRWWVYMLPTAVFTFWFNDYETKRLMKWADKCRNM